MCYAYAYNNYIIIYCPVGVRNRTLVFDKPVNNNKYEYLNVHLSIYIGEK